QNAVVSAQLQDESGNPVVAGAGGVVVSLASSSPGGHFSQSNGAALSGSTITIVQGSSTATFAYRDSLAGVATLSVSAPGFVSATQMETILPQPTPAGVGQEIVVGRTLTEQTTSEVQNNRVTITYTVYNPNADSLSGVLLTDTLAAGVSLVT